MGVHWMGVQGGIGWLCIQGHVMGIAWVGGHGGHWMSIHRAMDGCTCGAQKALDGLVCIVPVQLHGPWLQSNSTRPWFQSHPSGFGSIPTPADHIS